MGKKITVFLRTFGWPMVTVARDDFEAIKEDKWLGMNTIEKKS